MTAMLTKGRKIRMQPGQLGNFLVDYHWQTELNGEETLREFSDRRDTFFLPGYGRCFFRFSLNDMDTDFLEIFASCLNSLQHRDRATSANTSFIYTGSRIPRFSLRV